ncbi:MAG: hypothetical protein QNJ54_34115 [Prochloraceae cyanobacterium]|nr:hypothetical protein [Prochloraceae cyanobacterium]
MKKLKNNRASKSLLKLEQTSSNNLKTIEQELADKKKILHNCPCCSSLMLRHVRHKEIYWYCSHCYLEMPNTISVKNRHLLTNKK